MILAILFVLQALKKTVFKLRFISFFLLFLNIFFNNLFEKKMSFCGYSLHLIFTKESVAVKEHNLILNLQFRTLLCTTFTMWLFFLSECLSSKCFLSLFGKRSSPVSFCLFPYSDFTKMFFFCWDEKKRFCFLVNKLCYLSLCDG